MSVTISILADNRVSKANFIAEHGFSAFIQTDTGNFLFDTGQGMVLHHNARMMGINLCHTENVILSHGHYDHANGVRILYCNAKMRVYAHPMISSQRFRRTASGEYKDIGIEWLHNPMIADKIEWHLSDKPQWIAEHIVISGQIPRVTDFEQSSEPFFIINSENRYVNDNISDDQALFINTKSGIVILTGCAHSGLINTALYAREIFKQEKIHAIIGGTHLLHSSINRLHMSAKRLKDLKVDHLYAGHCTGFDASCYLKNELKNKYTPLEVGKQIIFDMP